MCSEGIADTGVATAVMLGVISPKIRTRPSNADGPDYG